MMAETCLLAEAAICYPPLYDELRGVTPRPTETVETVALAAVAAAAEQNAAAILVLSTSGNTARLISKYRPSVPIITGTVFFDYQNHVNHEEIYLSALLQLPAASRPPARSISTVDVIHSGTTSPVGSRAISGRSMCVPNLGHSISSVGRDADWPLLLCCMQVDNRIRFGLRSALAMNLLKPGSTIIAVQGWKGGLGHTNTMRVLSVPTDAADLEAQDLGAN